MKTDIWPDRGDLDPRPIEVRYPALRQVARDVARAYGCSPAQAVGIISNVLCDPPEAPPRSSDVPAHPQTLAINDEFGWEDAQVVAFDSRRPYAHRRRWTGRPRRPR